MSSKRRPARKKKKQRGAAIICRVFGTLILLFVIGLGLAFSLPRYMGYSIYHIISGSMEPEIPIGSAVFVEPIKAADVEDGSIIAFDNGNESVIVHRVVHNNSFEGKFTTKGDANLTEDINEVSYYRYLGIVVYHVPILGQILMLLSTGIGKIYAVCFAACGALLNIVAGRLEA